MTPRILTALRALALVLVAALAGVGGSHLHHAAAPKLAAFGPGTPGFTPTACQFVPSLGSASKDDGPQIAAALNSASGCAQLAPGATYTVLSTTTLPNAFPTLVIPPTTTVNCTIPDSPRSSSNACIFAGLKAVPNALTATLHATPTEGANSISVDVVTHGPPTAGMWLQVNGSASTSVAEIAYVEAVSGSGPYTLTLRDPILRTAVIVSGNTVTQVNPPQNVRVIGGGEIHATTGANINGRGVELSSCQGCEIDVHLTGPWYGAAASFDIGSADCVYGPHTFVDGGFAAGLTPPTWGLAAEVAYRIKWDHVTVTQAGTISGGCVILNDCIDCDVIASHTDGCTNGVATTVSDVSDTTGTRRSRVIGGSFNAARVAAGDVASPKATGHGIASANPELDVIGADVAYNADVGIVITTPSPVSAGGAARLIGTRSYLNGVGSIFAQSDVEIIDHTSRDDARASGGFVVQIGSAAVANIRGGTYSITSDVALTWEVFRLDGSGRVRIDGPRIEMRSAPAHTEIGIVTTGTSVIDLANTTIINGTYGALTTGSGTTIRRGANVVVVGSTVDYSNGGDYFSWFDLTLNGTTGVDQTFPDARAADLLVCTRKTAGSTTAISPTWTVTAGSKFTLTGATAFDNDVYRCLVH